MNFKLLEHCASEASVDIFPDEVKIVCIKAEFTPATMKAVKRLSGEFTDSNKIIGGNSHYKSTKDCTVVYEIHIALHAYYDKEQLHRYVDRLRLTIESESEFDDYEFKYVGYNKTYQCRIYLIKK